MSNLPAPGPEFHVVNDHPTKLYRIHVTGYHAPREGALEAFAERFPDREFFAPSATRIYRSLSAARDRAALLDFNGVAAVVVEADVDWRLQETKDAKIVRLEARIAELEGTAS